MPTTTIVKVTQDQQVTKPSTVVGTNEKKDGCRLCNEPNDNGEGWDGLCGDCADKAEKSLAQNKLLAIIGSFEKQRWIDDHAESIETVEFDATETILSLPLNQIKELVDCTYSTDAIGEENVIHDGPFSVYVTHNICKFFKVDDLNDITEENISAAKKWFAQQPEKEFTIKVETGNVKIVKLKAKSLNNIQSRFKEIIENDPVLRKNEFNRITDIKAS
jgi:hypothetical protein